MGLLVLKQTLYMLVNVQKKVQKDGDYWGASKGNSLFDVQFFVLFEFLQGTHITFIHTELTVYKRLRKRNSFALLRPTVNGRIEGQSMLLAGIRQRPHPIPHCPEFPGLKAAADSRRDFRGLGRWGQGGQGLQRNGKHQEVKGDQWRPHRGVGVEESSIMHVYVWEESESN